ncbi:MAG: hypothetical protein JKY65_10625 [Planctomycetes bacterium]|nr:hypothetical protein [Planctomycetota bacterium]
MSSLVPRARKATGLDMESFARLIGVPWQEIQRFEKGRKLETPYQEALFRILLKAPKEAIEALEQAKEAELSVGRTIIGLLLELGKGPKKTLSLSDIRKELRFGRNGFGVPGISPEVFKKTILDLDRLGHIVLQAAVDMKKISKPDRDAAIRDTERGFLVFASPGPRALRKKASKGSPRPRR